MQIIKAWVNFGSQDNGGKEAEGLVHSSPVRAGLKIRLCPQLEIWNSQTEKEIH